MCLSLLSQFAFFSLSFLNTSNWISFSRSAFLHLDSSHSTKDKKVEFKKVEFEKAEFEKAEFEKAEFEKVKFNKSKIIYKISSL